MAAAASSKLTFAEYVAREAASDVRHEFVDGQAIAMAGGTPEHSALCAAIVGEVRSALRGKPCRVFESNLRIRVLSTGLATYPDAAVVCGALATDPDDANTVVNPVLLVEVLSDSTEAYDRGEKAAHYRRIPALRELVLVSQHAPHVEVHRRNEQGRWEIHEARAGESIELASIGCALAVDAICETPLVRVAHSEV